MEKENYFAKPKKGELEKLFMDNCNTYFDRSKQGFPSEEVLKKQIDDHILLGGDKPVWFVENIQTNEWIKKLNENENFANEELKSWEDTIIPIEAMKFESKENCYLWICQNNLEDYYTPTDHLFSV